MLWDDKIDFLLGELHKGAGLLFAAESLNALAVYWLKRCPNWKQKPQLVYAIAKSQLSLNVRFRVFHVLTGFFVESREDYHQNRLRSLLLRKERKIEAIALFDNWPSFRAETVEGRIVALLKQLGSDQHAQALFG